ncbi:hypothetical protein Bca52824_066367 [Brassica carinata]|uniref:Uncharacterized protein n=1 Tax=Brassica carinata TaxID=52824 RepID=A0A8X7QLR9_BRACI|nr:hypothetical protein Bca52824_066367 [Brassica carinata]
MGCGESCRFKITESFELLCVLRVYRLINHCMRSSFTLCVWFVQLQRRSFGQGRRRVNKRTSLAQKEDVIKRTVYVKDIDQQGRTSFSQAAQIMPSLCFPVQIKGAIYFFDKETNAGENIDCGNIFKWSHLQKVDVSGKIVGNQQL